MRSGWQTKKLGELCEIELGKTPARANSTFWDAKRETSNVWLSIADLLNAEDNVVVDSKEYVSDKGAEICKLVPKGTLLASFKLTLGRLAFAGRDLFTNEAIAALSIFNERELSKEFLFYFLHFFDWVKAAENDVKLKGMTLNKAKLKEMPVHFPSPAEQKRIVRILDTAFEGIATAKANAGKNLQNARALFVSHLQSVFTRQQDEVPLSTLATEVTDGDHTPPPKAPTGIPFITISDIVKRTREVDFSNTFMVPAEYFQKLKPNKKPRVGDVLYTVTGATLGIPVLVREQRDFCFQRHIGLIRPKPDTDSAWLTYALLSPQVFRQATIGSTGAAQKTVSLNVLRNLKMPKQALAAQKRIASQLDAINAETERLTSLYERKLAALEALKKSLLHQAFTGELTKELPSVIIPFPATVPNITPTDLHAGILAIGYEFHETANRLQFYGHVKAEKISHMIEALVGIDLGRLPVQDAAGPNDFPHLKRVEHRARMAGFFNFREQAGAGYRMIKGRNFNTLINKVRTVLGGLNPKVDNLINLMLPLDMQQAEVFATVYAAWNNLLMEGYSPTDEQIVLAARENWHPDKLNIPRDKFFKAIDWIRKKNICPEGKGKKVAARTG